MNKRFLQGDFLLDSQTAETLYHQHAAKMPIIDYHCHIDPRQIYEDKPFDNLSDLWFQGDHYKWRAMRSCGVAEQYITGGADPDEKFQQWANILPRLIGNPLYHWAHLELQRYFGIDLPLGPRTYQEIWKKANQKMSSMSPRRIIEQSNVEVICTTDDPADDLRWHQLLQADESLSCQVFPAFRPDKALGINLPGFPDYLRKLSDSSKIVISSLDKLKQALTARLDAFCRLGCRTADHGLDYVIFEESLDADAIFQKALIGQAVAQKEADAFKTNLLCFLASQYRQRGMVMQLHFGAIRNCNPAAFDALGPDTGFDAIWGKADSGKNLAGLLGTIEKDGGLPKTILYSLNPQDNAQLDAIIGCFQTGECPGKLQHGSAWWFNDSITGMTEHIINLANFSALGHFIGMLTDSRSLLSFTRHEYFRRILCNIIGQWVDKGEYPRDMDTLGHLIEDICYHNAKRYFLPEQQ